MYRVYWNLHKKMWSLLGNDWKLIKHEHSLCLHDCSFIVRPAGRAKVLRTKRKNVHAFIIGKPFHPYELNVAFNDELQHIRYNPYVTDHFYINDYGNNRLLRVDNEKAVYLNGCGRVWRIS